MTDDVAAKIAWEGRVLGVQPRIRLSRSFDQRWHSYLGHVLRVQGSLGGEAREFLIAVGKAAQGKHRFRAGDEVRGFGVRVAEPKLEPADLYKASGFRFGERGPELVERAPPFHGVPPPVDEYRELRDRRLAAITYGKSCATCIWGCEMAVEIILDHWNQTRRRYRRETFCYGPMDCPRYAAGAKRRVRGREPWMIHVEEDEAGEG